MNFEIRVQSEAILDIQEAFEWYESQQAGLGYEFLEEVEDGYYRLCQHPLHYSSINAHLRRLKIDRFPYLIVYEIEGTVIVVNALHHTRKEQKF